MQIVLLEPNEEVRRPDQVWSRSHRDRVAIGQCDHREHALGGDSVAMKRLAHQRGRQTLLQGGRPASVRGVVVAGLEETAFFRRRGAQARDARSATRHVPTGVAVRDRSVPDTASVARRATGPAGVLQLEVPCGHVGAGKPVFLMQAPAIQLELVDDRQAERVENLAAKPSVEPVGVLGPDQTELAGEVEVEPDHLAAGKPAGRVIDKTARHRFLESVRTGEIFELGIFVLTHRDQT